MKTLPRLFYQLNRLLWRITRPTTVGVRLILVKDQTVLLVRHTYQPHWYLPGGGVKKGEMVEAAARREVDEEFGAKLGDLRLFGVYTNFYEHKNDHVVVLSCEDFTLTGKTDREIEDLDFFRFDDLPAGISPGSMRRIREYVDGSRLPGIGMW
jgi:8-oxo-dGTP pyrophosphatase MutT (NUDIX family)